MWWLLLCNCTYCIDVTIRPHSIFFHISHKVHMRVRWFICRHITPSSVLYWHYLDRVNANSVIIVVRMQWNTLINFQSRTTSRRSGFSFASVFISSDVKWFWDEPPWPLELERMRADPTIMYVYIYIYMCVWIYIYIYIYTHTSTSTSTYTYTYIHI